MYDGLKESLGGGTVKKPSADNRPGRERLPFTMIPNSFMDDPRVGRYAFLVFCALCKYANKDCQAFPGIRTLAKTAHCCTAYVQDAIKELVELGWISIETRYRKGTKSKTSNLYSINGVYQPLTQGVYQGLTQGVKEADTGGVSTLDTELDSSSYLDPSKKRGGNHAPPRQPGDQRSPTPGMPSEQEKESKFAGITEIEKLGKVYLPSFRMSASTAKCIVEFDDKHGTGSAFRIFEKEYLPVKAKRISFFNTDFSPYLVAAVPAPKRIAPKCPDCEGDLNHDPRLERAELICRDCGRIYKIDRGQPVPVDGYPVTA